MLRKTRRNSSCIDLSPSGPPGGFFLFRTYHKMVLTPGCPAAILQNAFLYIPTTVFLFSLLIYCFIPARSLRKSKPGQVTEAIPDWINPLNWSNQVMPLSTDDVLLDNGDLPVSYQVILPDQQVILRTLQIKPSPGRNIELILPVSNILTDAFSVTGPGYGIALFAGAIFRNASGLSSGESLQIADSIIIYDGAGIFTRPGPLMQTVY